MSLKQIKLPGLSLYRNLSTKQKKTANMVLGGLASVILVSFVSWVLSSSAPPPPPPELENVTPAELSAPGSNKVDPQQYWMATERKRLDHLEEFVNKIKQERDGRGAPTPAATSAASQAETAAPAASSASAPAPGEAKTPATGKPAVVVVESNDRAGGKPTPYPKQSQIAGTGTNGIPDPQRVNPNAPGAHLGLTQYPPGSPNSNTGSGPQLDASAARAPVIISVKAGASGAQGDKPAGGGQKAAGPKWNVTRNFLPVGFVRAKLLGGIDAATGGQSQSDPQPVLFLLQDDAILPNGWRSKVRNCFIVGGGVGDISSERAYIRLLTLSCVKHNGDVLEASVKGSVFGEDGKNGMRGRLVTKQGQILANAAMAGIASGIGKGFGNQGTTVSQSPLGVTTQQSQDAKTILNNSMAQGFGSAMDRLAQYWIERADRMYPVIEIDAGRMVDLAFTKGIEIDIVPGDDDVEALQAASGRNLDRSAEISALFKDM